MKICALIVSSAVLLPLGCASVAPQQVGQMLGTVAGAVAAPGIGAPIGGLVGLLAGMVVQKQVDKVTEKRERVDLGHELKTTPTAATAAAGTELVGTPTRVWVDETFQNGRVTPGSFQQRAI